MIGGEPDAHLHEADRKRTEMEAAKTAQAEERRRAILKEALWDGNLALTGSGKHRDDPAAALQALVDAVDEFLNPRP